MNNEIGHNINNYANAPIHSKAMQTSNHANLQQNAHEAQDCSNKIKNSMEFLGNINKVAIHTSVNDSVASFLANSEYVQHYNNIYDSLIERGYNAQRALQTSDAFMSILINRETYN